ncbi:hypothetical protein ACFHWD_19565 [Clostridium sp. MT-14]|uniref:Uncharacterized protein n=1 Tax=Clostridium aromativorans TaxID=2836848 RepID=A0ABS8NA45_9CLOT|nr:hypothetical protein [Clostridium aromativorans]MCC9296677.1 hypothetical protein [Clostridium aromativorans]
MLKMKYRLISAIMVLAPLVSTGVTTTVQAKPANTKSGIVYKTKYSYGNFKAQLDKLVKARIINNYQESKILNVFKSQGDFKTGLDRLVAAHIINSSQESKVIGIFNGSAANVKSTPAKQVHVK